MQRSKIEWTDYTLNPIKGLCPVDCKDNQGKSYCYARAMYKRFKWNPEIYLETGVFADLPSKPSRIFIGSTMELFGNWIKAEWMNYILDWVRDYPQHTFIFLTKQPQNLIQWSPFPSNVWVGASATNWETAFNALWEFQDVRAKVKFISFEPLLDWTNRRELEGWLIRSSISWLIIGQQTPVRKATMPKIEWIKEIVEACDKANIPIFLKENLRCVLPSLKPFRVKDGSWYLRQEFPS